MKHTRMIFLLVALLVLLGACKSGAEFRVVNRCTFPTYVALDDGEFKTISGGEEHIFKIDIDTQSFLTGEVSKNMTVFVYGQTYSIIDDISKPQQDSTVVVLKAGKRLNAYLHPNRACIMIRNNSAADIAKAEIWRYKHNSIEQQRVATIEGIASGEEKWQRVLPMATGAHGDSFYYVVEVFEDISLPPQVHGDPDNVLYTDQRWVLELE